MNVYLDDDEVVDLIMERPHLIAMAFERYQKQLEEANDLSTTALQSNSRLRKKIKELEKPVDTP